MGYHLGMHTIRLLLPLLLGLPALANDAEIERLTEDIEARAVKGQWSGVERLYNEIDALDIPSPEVLYLGAQAAAQAGDAQTAFRRAIYAERGRQGSTEGMFQRYVWEYGRLAVHRLDRSCIRLTPLERPFDPVKSSAIDFAAKELEETGAFFGILPKGSYNLGPYRVDITGGPGEVVVWRDRGDSDC